MRQLIRHLVDARLRPAPNASRSGDRIGVASSLGSDVVRLARMAASIHLAETALEQRGDSRRDVARLVRETT